MNTKTVLSSQIAYLLGQAVLNGVLDADFDIQAYVGHGEADAQALDDVRTLDANTTNKNFWRLRPHNPDAPDCEYVRMVWSDLHRTFQIDECFSSTSPDAARAKAAEWVRKR